MTIMDVTGLTKESIDKMEPLSGEAILKIPSQANAFIIEEKELDDDDVISSSSSSSSIDYSFSKTHLYIPKESESIIEIEILDISNYYSYFVLFSTLARLRSGSKVGKDSNCKAFVDSVTATIDSPFRGVVGGVLNMTASSVPSTN
jgi:hypothetical protein